MTLPGAGTLSPLGGTVPGAGGCGPGGSTILLPFSEINTCRYFINTYMCLRHIAVQKHSS